MPPLSQPLPGACSRMGAEAPGESGERPGGVRLWISNPANRRLIWALVGCKVFVLGLVLASAGLFPGAFSLEGYQANFHWPPEKEPGMAERFMTWDGEHYLYLSRHGYRAGSSSAAFYPLWPALIWLGDKISAGHRLIAALVMSNLFSIAAWLLFHRLVERDHGRGLADLALLFLLAFPGSLFFQFPYSESAFLLLAMLLFWGMARNDLRWLMIAGVLLPLTRSVGLFCCLPLAVNWWMRGRRWRDSWVVFTPVVGWGLYLLVMALQTGNAFEGFAAQKFFLANASVGKLFAPLQFIDSFFRPLQLHGFLDSTIDRVFFLCFIAGLIPLYGLNKTYFSYALALGLVPAITNSMVSYTRYLAVVFPLFIVAAQYFSAEGRRYWRFAALAALFALQILFLWRHINFHWAG